MSESLGSHDSIGTKLYEFAASDADLPKDKWLPTALTMAGARHAPGFLTAAAKASSQVDLKNLLPNPGFEESLDDANTSHVSGWTAHTFDGTAIHEHDDKVAHSGRKSVRISNQENGNPKGTDASWFAELNVEPNTNYLFTAWIRTEKVSPSRSTKGAIIEVIR